MYPVATRAMWFDIILNMSSYIQIQNHITALAYKHSHIYGFTLRAQRTLNLAHNCNQADTNTFLICSFSFFLSVFYLELICTHTDTRGLMYLPLTVYSCSILYWNDWLNDVRKLLWMCVCCIYMWSANAVCYNNKCVCVRRMCIYNTYTHAPNGRVYEFSRRGNTYMDMCTMWKYISKYNTYILSIEIHKYLNRHNATTDRFPTNPKCS